MCLGMFVVGRDSNSFRVSMEGHFGALQPFATRSRILKKDALAPSKVLENMSMINSSCGPANMEQSIWEKKRANYLTMKGASKDPAERKAAKSARKARRKNRK